MACDDFDVPPPVKPHPLGGLQRSIEFFLPGARARLAPRKRVEVSPMVEEHDPIDEESIGELALRQARLFVPE